MNSSPAEGEDEPLDPAVEKIRRKMVRLLVVSFGIMSIGLLAVLASIIYKLYLQDDKPSAKDQPTGVPNEQIQTVAPGSYKDGDFDIPDGSKLVSARLSGGRLVVTLQHVDGSSEIMIIAPETGKALSRYKFR